MEISSEEEEEKTETFFSSDEVREVCKSVKQCKSL
jgi:hypothetical protein